MNYRALLLVTSLTLLIRTSHSATLSTSEYLQRIPTLVHEAFQLGATPEQVRDACGVNTTCLRALEDHRVAGKGSRQRTYGKQFNEGWERIFLGSSKQDATPADSESSPAETPEYKGKRNAHPEGASAHASAREPGMSSECLEGDC